MNDAPRRPSIPPIAWFAAAMWGGCILAEQVSWAVWSHAATDGRVIVPTVLVTGAMVLAGTRARRVRAVVVLVVAGALAGAAVSGLAAVAWHRQSALARQTGARVWAGTVEADPIEGSYGTSVRVRLAGGPLDGARARVSWPETARVPELGRTVRFSAVLEPLPAEEVWSRRVARTGASATGRAWRAELGAWRAGPAGRLLAWRASVLDAMHDIPGPGGALAEGIVLGDRRRLIGTPAEEDFRILGLSHLVAVSGSHLALACGAVVLLGGMMRIPRRPLVLLTVATGAAYAIVTGMPYSALRSLWMLVVGGAGQLAGRRGDGVASLATAVVAVLAVDPWTVFDVGFQLSALAVAGLLLFGGLASTWTARAFGGRWRAVTGALALTGVAQAATVTVSASTFGMLSVLAPVANAIASPLVTVALWLGLGGAVAGSVVPVVGSLGIRAAATVLAATAWVASWLARLPGAAIALAAGTGLAMLVAGGAVLLWVWWPLPRSRAIAVRVVAMFVVGSVALGVGPAPARSASIVVLDVGQGDAVLVRDAGRSMLVDAGADGTVLRRAIARHGLRRADVLVLTHAHDDHTGGARGLSSVLDIGWIGVPAVVGDDGAAIAEPVGRGLPVRALGIGDTWRLGSTVVRVLWPPAEAEVQDELSTNDTSVVLLVSRGGFDAALTGDAEEAAQLGMEARGLLGEVEVLKVPHHGSVNGLTERAAALWDPEVSLISVGTGNDFGHPSPATLGLLERMGSRVLRTDRSGDLVVRIGRRGYSVSPERRSETAAVRGTIRQTPSACGVPRGTDDGAGEGARGGQEHRGAQAGLPDLWEGRPVARARAPPVARAHRRRGGPGLQLPGVRRGDRRTRGDRGRGQHRAVRVRTAARGGA